MWFSMLEELNATNGRESVQSFVKVFVKLLLILSSCLGLQWVGIILTLCP